MRASSFYPLKPIGAGKGPAAQGRSTWAAVCCLLLLFVLIGPRPALAAGPEEDVADGNAIVRQALAAARSGDLATAKQLYDRYENQWFDTEDGVRAKSRDAYRNIEKFMNDFSVAYAKTPPDKDAVISALAGLDREQQLFIQGQPASDLNAGAAAAPGTPVPANPTVGTLLSLLHEAQGAVAAGDYAGAAATMKTFDAVWLEVEGEIKTRSSDAYRQTENDMALASTMLAQGSPEAKPVLDRMASRLEPYTAASQYGVFDAAAILLREGLEALLVVVALLAFIKRSATPRGEAWIWGGAVAGILASIVLGVAIQLFFSAIINPSNRELLEGVVGLFAAAMLVYVSYWLHSKANLGGWQRYLAQRTSAALRGGSLVGLAVLSFLAIFREGAETALFYLGMAPSIATGDLLLGLVLGFGILVVIGVLMTVVGIRIPMRPFFLVASVLVFYLCFKFVGTGIHALQIAGLIPAAAAPYLPEVGALGMYSTWPTTIAQLILLLAAAWVVLRDRVKSHQAQPPVHAHA